MHSIGFIGASGMMGHGMAKNLRARGHALALTVHRNRERVADLLAAGASVATSPSLLAGHCDIVFICVTGSPQVEAAVAGRDGLLAGARAGLVIARDCANSAPPPAWPSWMRRWRARRSRPSSASSTSWSAPATPTSSCSSR
jgi:3-hydroxyisobutyrate dehydrogenase-like beta-hydroxyacid dehydrogenase